MFLRENRMTVVLTYVDKYGIVKERFVDLDHVTETTSAYLKSSLIFFLRREGRLILNLDKIHPQITHEKI